MNYRLIALDLDETLLGGDSKISPRNKNAVREAAKRGLIITIATGRMFRSSIPHVRELELNTDWPMINYHGALIKTTESQKVISHQPLPNELALSMIRDAELRGYFANIFMEDRLYIKESNEFSQYYQKLADIEIEPVGDLAPFLREHGGDPSKLAMISWEGALEELEEHYIREYGDRIVAMQSRPYFLEVTHRCATKGQALALLADREGIKREEVIAFGDNYNDMDMIRYAGLGVAMANAVPELKAAADLVAPANTEDGVAQVIEQYVLT